MICGRNFDGAGKKPNWKGKKPCRSGPYPWPSGHFGAPGHRVEAKEQLGDWEANTIVGKGHRGAIVSLVGRATKYTFLGQLGKKRKRRSALPRSGCGSSPTVLPSRRGSLLGGNTESLLKVN